MARFFPKHLLYRIRNEIPVAPLVTQLQWPHKQRDGRFCFLCPRCSEFLTRINPRTNLARCFHCKTNFNPIDLVMRIKSCDFVAAIDFLEPQLPTETAR